MFEFVSEKHCMSVPCLLDCIRACWKVVGVIPHGFTLEILMLLMAFSELLPLVSFVVSLLLLNVSHRVESL